MNSFSIRHVLQADCANVGELYRAVAAIEGGLARTADEITDGYIEHFIQKSRDGGLGLVAVNNLAERIIGEIHAYPLGPSVFAHVLGELTIAVAPDQQGSGVGKALFTEFLKRVERDRPAILRIELIARESNERAISFYQRLGFRIEGRFERRIKSVNGGYEADIPMAWLRP